MPPFSNHGELAQVVERPICISFSQRRCDGVVNVTDSKSVPFGGAGSNPADVFSVLHELEGEERISGIDMFTPRSRVRSPCGARPDALLAQLAERGAYIQFRDLVLALAFSFFI